MSSKVTISNPTGDHEEILERLAKNLGRSKQRIAVFKEIYRGSKQFKTAGEIAKATGLTETRVLQLGGELVDRHLALAQLKGSPPRKAYSKDPTVKPIRDKLLKLVEQPENISKIPTKRKNTPTLVIKGDKVLNSRNHTQDTAHILYLTAAGEENNLRVDGETRLIQEQLRGAKFGSRLTIHPRPAAGAKTLIDGLNDLRPNVVHFSGHAGQGGVVLDSGNLINRDEQFIDFELLRDILEATDSPPKILVLNACDTSSEAETFLTVVDHVVAMKTAVSDLAAATFAAGFYSALAAGQPLKQAFKQGSNAIKIMGSPEAHIPFLHSKDGNDPAKFKLF